MRAAARLSSPETLSGRGGHRRRPCWQQQGPDSTSVYETCQGLNFPEVTCSPYYACNHTHNRRMGDGTLFSPSGHCLPDLSPV